MQKGRVQSRFILCHILEGLYSKELILGGILCYYLLIKTCKIYYYIDEISISLAKTIVPQPKVTFILL